MANLSRNDVLKLAQLSKIRLRDDEVDKFVEELGAIVKFVEQIDSADVSGLEPTDQVTGLSNIMRPDEIANYQADPDELLKNLPSSEGKYIKVKRVLQ